jgi:hypothetical protein
MSDTTRHLVRVPISFELLAMLMRTGPVDRFMYVDGVPKDAVLVGSYTNNHEQTGYLVFSHSGFPATPFGTELPTLTPVVYKFSSEWELSLHTRKHQSEGPTT